MSSASPREIDARGPRFAAWVTAVVLPQGSGRLVAAQAVVFAVGAGGYLLGAPVLGAVATGLALLDAATGFRPGCELHPIARRALPARA